MKNKRRGDKIKSVRLGMMTAVLSVTVLTILAQSALGITRYGASGLGRTLVTASSCDAYVTATVPAVLDVDNGDIVRIWYNYTWGDSRTYWSPDATHVFHMDVTYLGTTQSHDDTQRTNGNTGGGTNAYKDVFNVQERTYIWVNWTASISSTSPQCYDFDSKGGPVYLG